MQARNVPDRGSCRAASRRWGAGAAVVVMVIGREGRAERAARVAGGRLD